MCEFDCIIDPSTEEAQCLCPMGHILSSKDNRTCMNLTLVRSSCDIENGGCQQICHNVEIDELSSSEESIENNSYSLNVEVRCSCNQGFQLTEDNATCVSLPISTVSLFTMFIVCFRQSTA